MVTRSGHLPDLMEYADYPRQKIRVWVRERSPLWHPVDLIP